MYIPAINLKLQYRSIKNEIDHAIAEVFDQGQFIGGEKVRAFEEKFAKQYKVKHCIAVGNGTDALFISLKMLGLKSGDEVITPAFSWISTSETISSCGAIPVFADVHPETLTLDPEQLKGKITSRTKAIVVVHLFGQAASIKEIKEICLANNLKLLEDCAQAHFTEEENQLVGTFGDAATLSFYPTKNLGAFGDAGCVITNNDLLQ
jgi:dTDP-4-amino-4,6-dideoxygalactose transaminase